LVGGVKRFVHGVAGQKMRVFSLYWHAGKAHTIANQITASTFIFN
jgi:hypothetical protein